MKRTWTRGEKWLFAAPILFGAVAVGLTVGPNAARRALGWPRVLATSPTNHISGFALSKDGSILAASGRTDPIDKTSGTIYLWNARTLQPLKPIPTNSNRRTLSDFVTRALSFSPKGQLLGAQRHGLGYSLYRLPSTHLLWRKRDADYAEFSPDGKSIALSTTGTVHILNAANGVLIRTWTLSTGSLRPYNSALSWSLDGKVIACLGSRFNVLRQRGDRASGQFIELWRVADGKRIKTISSELTTSVRFSPDGKELLAVGQYPSPMIGNGTEGNGVRLYDVKTGAKKWEVDGRKLFKNSGNYAEQHFRDAVFSPDGKSIATFQHTNQSVLLLDRMTGRQTRRLRFRERSSNQIGPPALAFSPEGKRLYASADNAVLVWDLK